MDKNIQVVHPEKKRSENKEDFSARPIFEIGTDHVGEIRIAGGVTGKWHHHGKRTMYGYVVSGKVNLEYGKNGQERVTISQGDFFLIPPEFVHRDVNPNKEEAFLLIFNMGVGPTTVDLSGPNST